MEKEVQLAEIKTSSAIPAYKKSRTKVKHYEVIPELHNPVRGEMAIWVAVITQAMMDALSKSANPEALYLKHEATRWLMDNSADFVTVCLLAGFDPDYIRRMAKKALAAPRPWRAEAGKGKRYQERKAYRKKTKEKQKKLTAYDSSDTSAEIIEPWKK